jgi:hypothetical protein
MNTARYIAKNTVTGQYYAPVTGTGHYAFRAPSGDATILDSTQAAWVRASYANVETIQIPVLETYAAPSFACPDHAAICEAVETLAGSPRGSDVLRALGVAASDLIRLDRGNSDAFRTLALAFASHERNGTLVDLLVPFKYT